MENKFVGFRRAVRWARWIWLAFIALGVPTATLAATNCPWMNEATASGLLGGNAVGAYTASNADQPAVCSFTRSASDVTRELRITVEVIKNDSHARLMQLEAGCGPNPASLKAIGNEAIACVADKAINGRGARAAGRVRDQVFQILIITTRKDDPILTRDALRIRINTAAEQVSGNLF